MFSLWKRQSGDKPAESLETGAALGCGSGCGMDICCPRPGRVRPLAPGRILLLGNRLCPGNRDTPKGLPWGGCFLGRALRSFQLLQRGFRCKGCISLSSTTLPAQTPGTEWELASLKANWWDWCELDWLLALGCAGVASSLSCGQCSGCWPPLSYSFPWKCAKIPGFDPCPPSNLAGMGRWDPAGLGKTGRQLDRQTDRQSV